MGGRYAAAGIVFEFSGAGTLPHPAKYAFNKVEIQDVGHPIPVLLILLSLRHGILEKD
jgi:hypothetical protein